MKAFRNCLCLAIFNVILYSQIVLSDSASANVKANEDASLIPAEITEGLQAGDKLLHAVSDASASTKVLPVMTRLAISFTSALGNLLNLYSDGMISVRARKRAAELLQEYNGRLMELNTEFLEVTQLMEWSTVKAAFSQYEQSLRALEDSFSLVLNAPEAHQETQTAFFRTLFENDYKNAATKLFQSITSDNFLFSENLFTAVKKATRNHRRLTRQFAMGIHSLVVLGAEMEIAYLKFSGIVSNQDFVSEYWGNNLETLRAVIDDIDKELFNSWEKQAKEDIQDYQERFQTSKDHRSFTNGLAEFLTDKYEWRMWFVMAYSPVTSYDKHAVFMCPHTWVYFRQNDRNLIISSVETESSSIQFSDYNAKTLLKNILPSEFPSILQKDRSLYLLKLILLSLKGSYSEICQQNYAMIAVLTEESFYTIHGEVDHYFTTKQVVKTFLKHTGYHFVFFG